MHRGTRFELRGAVGIVARTLEVVGADQFVDVAPAVDRPATAAGEERGVPGECRCETMQPRVSSPASARTTLNALSAEEIQPLRHHADGHVDQGRAVRRAEPKMADQRRPWTRRYFQPAGGMAPAHGWEALGAVGVDQQVVEGLGELLCSPSGTGLVGSSELPLHLGERALPPPARCS